MSNPLDGYHSEPRPTVYTNNDQSINFSSAKFLLVVFVVTSVVLTWLFAFYYRRRISSPSGSTPSAGGRSNLKILNMNAIVAIPIFVYSSSAEQEKLECTVCLSEFKDGEHGRTLPSCGHKFHAECVDEWFRSRSTCPLCRAPAQKQQQQPSEASPAAV